MRIYDKRGKWITQQQRIFASLWRSPKTRLMASNEANVPLQNTCRYVGKFLKRGTVHVVEVKRDPISGMPAEWLTTNPQYFPSAQMKLFE